MRLTKAVINTRMKINSFQYKFRNTKVTQIMNKQDAIIQTEWNELDSYSQTNSYWLTCY